MDLRSAKSTSEDSPMSENEGRSIDETEAEEFAKQKIQASDAGNDKRAKLTPHNSKSRNRSRQPLTDAFSEHEKKEMYSLSTGSDAADPAEAHEQEDRHQKERFQVFLPFLLEYISRTKPSLCQKAKALIGEWDRIRRDKECGYDSVTYDSSIKARLHELIGRKYWKGAKVYFKQYTEEQQKKAVKQGLPFHLSNLLETRQQTAHKLATSSSASKKAAVGSSKPKAKPPVSDTAATPTMERKVVQPPSTFARHFESLKELMKAHYPDGGYVLPSECKCNKTLQGWIYHVRHQYRSKEQGKSHWITDQQIDQLNGISFHWENPSIPRNPVDDSLLTGSQTRPRPRTQVSNPEDVSKLTEAPTAKRNRSKPQKSDSSKQGVSKGGFAMEAEEPPRKRCKPNRFDPSKQAVSKFLSETEREPPTPKRGRSKKGDSSKQVEWDVQFEKLKDHMEIHPEGYARVSKCEPRLSAWLERQRLLYKRRVLGNTSSLSNERIEKMERLGFMWVEDKSKTLSSMEHDTPNRGESKFTVSSPSDSSSSLPQANSGNSDNASRRSTFQYYGHTLVVDDIESNTSSSEEEDDWSDDEE